MLRHLCCWLAVCVVACSASTSQAYTLIPKSIEELTQEATHIFIGIPRAQVTTAPKNLLRQPKTKWTVEVKEVLKGDLAAGADFTWEQGAHQGYELNQEYLLFLFCVGNRCAPKGAVQGIFKVTTLPDGTQEVTNNLNNRFLFPQAEETLPDRPISKGARTSMSREGKLSLDNMRELIESVQTETREQKQP